MSLDIRILGSSSRGNAALICSKESKILIDAGFSGKKIEQKLHTLGESIENIDAVFLTHEHGDHSQGLRGLAKHQHLRVFANRDTSDEVRTKFDKSTRWDLFETGSTFLFKDIEVQSFPVPHDAADPVGFSFSSGGEDLFSPRRQIAWCTDLGHATHLIHERLRAADTVVIEANHDTDMLEASERTWPIKQRIKGRHGHLCNEAALNLLREVERPRWKNVVLAHMSRECNCIEKVQSCFEGIVQERAWNMHIVGPDAPPAALALS